MGYSDIEVSGTGDFLKLTAANVVTINLLSREPKKEIVHWINKKRSTCLINGCENCMNGDKPKQRWTAEVWDRKENAVKKLEFGAMIASQFKEIAALQAENGKTIHDTDIRIKTTGAGIDSEYSCLPVPMSGSIPQEVSDRFVPF
jgi:hypothetical protein